MTTVGCMTTKVNATANPASAQRAKNAVEVQIRRILRHVVSVEQSYASRSTRSSNIVVLRSVRDVAKEYVKNAMTLSILQTNFADADLVGVGIICIVNCASATTTCAFAAVVITVVRVQVVEEKRINI